MSINVSMSLFYVKKKLHAENIYRWNDVWNSLRNNTGGGSGGVGGRDETSLVMSTVCPLCLQVLYPQIQLTADWKYSRKKKFQKVPKSKSWICHIGNYLNSIYIVSGIISELEMT